LSTAEPTYDIQPPSKSYISSFKRAFVGVRAYRVEQTIANLLKADTSKPSRDIAYNSIIGHALTFNALLHISSARFSSPETPIHTLWTHAIESMCTPSCRSGINAPKADSWHLCAGVQREGLGSDIARHLGRLGRGGVSRKESQVRSG